MYAEPRRPQLCRLCDLAGFRWNVPILYVVCTRRNGRLHVWSRTELMGELCVRDGATDVGIHL